MRISSSDTFINYVGETELHQAVQIWSAEYIV